MPYVNESRNVKGPDIKVYCLSNGTVIGNFPWNTYNPSQSQYGFRSGPLSKDETAKINHLNETGVWADQAQQIDALERLAAASTPYPKVDTTRTPVHERKFFNRNSPATKVLTRCNLTSPAQSLLWQGAFGCQPGSTSSGYRSDPVRNTYLAKATQLMRSMRPTKPEFELARFIGELRDLPRVTELLQFQALVPKNWGGSYVGYQFGVAPTHQDLMKAAEAVMQSDKIVREFAEQAKSIVSRRRKLQLASDSSEGSSLIGMGLQGAVNVGPVAVYRSLGSSTSRSLKCDTYLGYNRELRVFADFEFYVADPYGYTSRMDSYMANAQKLLGSGTSLATIWNLTPWTWLSDWFLDIGSLLRYQQDVADNGLAARRSGFTIEDTYTASATLGSYSTSAYSNTLLGATTATCVEKRQWRYASSPYSMAFNWDLSDFQTAVLAALGISKMPGLSPILP